MFLTAALICFCSLSVITGNEQNLDDPEFGHFDKAIPSAGEGTLPLEFQDSSNSLSQSTFQCPHPTGDFHDEVQCDKFWRCEDNIAVSHLCDDGLVFDILKADGRDAPCESPYVVDCEHRLELQIPSFPTPYCPRLNGYFAPSDPAICSIFYTCINGIHTETACSHGLHFNEMTGNCDWPHLAGRENCSLVAKKKHSSGFSCPDGEFFNSDGLNIPHPLYRDPLDCQKFFVCLNGITPQEASCSLGEVFNENSMTCTIPSYGTDCYGWYRNDARFYDYYYDEPIIPADIEVNDVV